MERIPCVNQDSCRLRDSIQGCREDVHHAMWPRSEYNSGLARRFRELPGNKVRICRVEHDEIHATEQPPDKPSAAEMRDAIELSRIGHHVLEVAS